MTVVSLYDARGLRVFIRGRNLEDLPEQMAASRFWVSCNGSCFDLPVLRTHFGCFPEPELHPDLRFLCRRIGLPGGLRIFDRELLYDLSTLLLQLGSTDA